MKKLLVYILHIPLYYLSYFIKKDPNLWIFGAWSGNNYSDNSKYLFEYVNQQHPDIHAVWITKNKDVFKKVSKYGYDVEYAYSLRGYWLSIKSKVAVISNTKLGDLNGFVINKKTIVVQLWHGNPIKKIGFDSISKVKMQNNEKVSFLFPYLRSNYEIFALTSEHTLNFFKSAYKVQKEKFYITGYPRNDILFNKLNSKISDYKYNIIYMPTFRENIEDEQKLIDNLDFNSLNSFLAKNNMKLFIKLHPLSKIKSTIERHTTKHIELFEVENIYEYLNAFDLLITDYSSIYFDFLLLDKPMILAPFDLEEYASQRGIYQDYKQDLKEYIAYEWDDIVEYLEEIFILNNDRYSEQRYEMKKKYNMFCDNKSTERVFSQIKKLLTNKERSI